LLQEQLAVGQHDAALDGPGQQDGVAAVGVGHVVAQRASLVILLIGKSVCETIGTLSAPARKPAAGTMGAGE
jgi:hypothetical protein